MKPFLPLVATAVLLSIGAVDSYGAAQTNSPAPATSGSGPKVEEPFLTGAIEAAVQMSGRTQKVWIPDDKKLSFVWSDRPFALHVPFQMETEVRQLSQYAVPKPGDIKTAAVYAKDYDVRANFRGFVYTNGSELRISQPALFTVCIYRFDGQPVYVENTNKYFLLERLRIPNLQARPDDTGYAFRLNGRLAVAPGRAGFCLVFDPRETPQRRDDQGLVAGGITQPAWEIYGEQAKGTLEVKVAERGKPATERQFDFAIHQNGWLLRQPKLSVSGDWSRPSKTTSGVAEEWRFADLGTDVKGLTVTTRHRMIVGSPYDRANDKATEVELVLQLPPRVFDQLPSSGSLYLNQTKGGTFPGSAKYGLQLYGYGGAVSFNAFRYAGETNKTNQIDLFPYKELGHVNTFDAMARSKDAKTGLHSDAWRVDIRPPQRGAFIEGRDQQNVLVWNWPAGQPIDSHKLFTADINFYASGGPQKPAKQIEFAATRISDVEDNRIGRTTTDGPVEAVKIPDDGFFTWQPEFRAQTGNARQQIAEIKMRIHNLAKEKNNLRGQWRDLWRMDVRSFPAMDEGGGLADMIFRFGKDVAYGGRKTIPLQPTMSKERLLLLKNERAQIDAKIQQVRADQTKLLEEADQVVRGLLTSAQIQAPQTEEGRRQLVWDTVDYYEDFQRMTKVELMEYGECFEPEAMQKAIDALKVNNVAAPDLATYMQGVYWYARAREYDDRFHNQMVSPTPPPPHSDVEKMARGAWIEALMNFRKVLELNPTHKKALEKRIFIELKLVQMIAAKVDAEQRMSIDTFERFVTARGYRAKEATNWPEGICETGYILLSSLPSTFAYGVANTVGTMADTVEIEVSTAARNQVSLMSIRRLLEKKMRLSDIPNLTPAIYEKYVPLKTWSKEKLPAERAERMCRDIRETFADLGDLRALASGDKAQIEAMMDRSYFASYNPETSWPEFFANLFINPVALIAAAPSATLTVGGKLTTLGNLLTRSARIQKFGAAVGASPLGTMVGDYVTVYNSLSTATAGLNVLAGIGASVVISGGAAEIASSHDLPMLALLIHALAAIGLERFAYNFIAESGVPAARMAAAVEEVSAAVVRKEAEMAKAAKVLAALKKIEQRLSTTTSAAGRVLTEAEHQEVRALVFEALGARPHLPGDNPESDLLMALREAARKLEVGDKEGARRALAAALKAQEECTEDLVALSQSVSKARDVLSKSPAPIPPLAEFDPDPDVAKALRNPVGTELPAPLEPPGGYPNNKFGSAMQSGDEALKKGDFAAAAIEYGKGKKWADAENSKGMQSAMEKRLRRVQNAERCQAHLEAVRKVAAKPRVTAKAGPTRPTDAITSSEIADLVRMIEQDASKLSPLKDKGKNPIFLITNAVGAVFVFKYLVDPVELESECAVPSLANLLGSKLKNKVQLQAPGSAPLEARNALISFVNEAGVKNVRPVKGVLSRFIDMKELSKLTEPEVLALKKEYAIQRVFRLWMGDTDGHLRNQLRAIDGGFFGIDFGYADFQEIPRLRQALKDKLTGEVHTFPNQQKLLVNALEFSYGSKGQSSLYALVDRMDDFITFTEMEEAVHAIEQLCANPAELERTVLQNFGEARKDQVLKVLVERGKLLRDELRIKFDPTHLDYAPKPHMRKRASADAIVRPELWRQMSPSYVESTQFALAA